MNTQEDAGIMEYKDYYKMLGVAKEADAEAIKSAYRKLARKYHPDVNKEADAEARFKDINEAYEVLKDPEKRAAYDRFGADWENARKMREGGFGQPGGGAFHGGSGAAGMDGRDFGEFFESLFGARAAHGGAAGGFGGAFSGGDFALPGEDQLTSITITLEEAASGAKKTLRLQRPSVDAQGRVAMRDQQLNVAIPKGVMAGQRIRLEGQGLPGHGGGPAGDLYLEIRFAPHPLFRAEKRDLHLDLPVAPWEAALGASLTVPTLADRVRLKVPPGSQNGRRLRLKGKGLAAASGAAGDLIVTLKVVLPEAKTDEQQALYRRMAEEMAFNPRADWGEPT